jgi:hypothetical protein
MDVAEYARRFHAQLDWEQVVARARAWRAVGRLTATLRIAHNVLGLGVAADMLDRLPPLTYLQCGVLRGLGPRAVLGSEAEHDRLLTARTALLMDRWGDAVGLLGPCLLPPRAYVEEACPGPWTWLPGGARLAYLVRGLGRMARAQLVTAP